MSQNAQQRRIEEVIAKGQALSHEARLLLERTRRQLKLMGIDPHVSIDDIKEKIGDEAFAQAQREAEKLLEDMASDLKRDAMHAQAQTNVSRHVRPRANRV